MKSGEYGGSQSRVAQTALHQSRIRAGGREAHRPGRAWRTALRTRGSRLAVVAAVLTSTLVAGCFPLAATTIGAGGFAIADRRTMGAQIEDQSIQVRANSRVKEVLPGNDQAYGTVTSFNRNVLLVGRAPDEAARERAEELVRSVGNVKSLRNDLRIGGPIISAINDTALTARVRTALLQVKGLEINAVRIVSENAVVYLMGLVTQDEADLATTAASKVSGVSSVVSMFEVLTEAQLVELIGKPVESGAPSGPPSDRR